MFFRVTEAKGVSPVDLGKVSVSLSRIQGGCVFPLTGLHLHDGHHPPFFDGGEGEAGDTANPYNKYGGEKAADAYTERVFAEIKEKAAAALPGVTVEFQKTEWTDDDPPAPNFKLIGIKEDAEGGDEGDD